MSERKKPPRDSYSGDSYLDGYPYLRQVPEDFDLARATKPLSRWWRICKIFRFLFGLGR